MGLREVRYDINHGASRRILMPTIERWAASHAPGAEVLEVGAGHYDHRPMFSCTLTKFDAEGMMGATNIVDKVPTDCSMLLQLQDKKYVRVWPKKKGTFDCRPSNLATSEADLVGG